MPLINHFKTSEWVRGWGDGLYRTRKDKEEEKVIMNVGERGKEQEVGKGI